MSLNTTPTDPNADSYGTLAEANSYFENLTDVTEWDALTDSQKEALLKKAARQIDSLRMHKGPYFPRPIYGREKQNLKFPTEKPENSTSGSVESAGNDYIIDTNRTNSDYEPSDLWNEGAIIITTGTGQGQTRKISDFDATTGKITISENWTNNPDSTSQYILLYKVPDVVKYAQFEQAVFNLDRDKVSEAKQTGGVERYRIGDLMEDFGETRGYTAGKVKLSDEAKGYLRGYYSIIGKFA
jgi:hypothetical protein